jgi:hypothetical protein
MQCRRGCCVETGFNEAFLISNENAKRLEKESATTSEILHPLIRGRDASRWIPRESEACILSIQSSENTRWPWSDMSYEDAERVFRKCYPAVYNHLRAYRSELQQRQDQGRYWWELRSCAYYDKLIGPKLIIQSIAYHSVFCRCRSGVIPNNSLFFLPNEDLFVLAILNSPVAWCYMFNRFPHKKDEAVAMDAAAVKTLPIPGGGDKAYIHQLVQLLIEEQEKQSSWEHESASKIDSLVERNGVGRKSILKVGSDWESFLRIVTTTCGFRLNAVAERRLRILHRDALTELRAAATQRLAMEGQLAAAVEDAYGLTSEERRVLRANRPVRDPLDVLEARLKGIEGVDSVVGGDDE